MYPPKNTPPTMPACALLSDHSSRSCGSSAANVENPSIEQTCAAIRIGTVRMRARVLPKNSQSLSRLRRPRLVPGPLDDLLRQAHRDGGPHGGDNLLPDRSVAARHLVRLVDRTPDGDPQPLRLLGDLLPLVRAVDREPDSSQQQHHHRAGTDEDHRMLAHLQLHVRQLVAAPIQLRQRAVEARAQVLDVALDLPRSALLSSGRRAVPLFHARRSFAHSTSSLRLRRVASSGFLTRFPHPTRPATVPTASTTPATISAAAHSGMTLPRASAMATSIRLTAQIAQRPATPSPFTIATSFFTSARSSDLASSISFLASWVAFSITCPIGSRFDIPSTDIGTAVCRP